MADQYVAADTRTDLQVAITGSFPGDPDDRVRIARTATLFTRLFATILATEHSFERRQRFRAVETQLEIAEAVIRQDFAEVQRLMRETMAAMGVTDEQLQEIEAELRRQLDRLGGAEPSSDERRDAPRDG